jgi:hypothetical protein
MGQQLTSSSLRPLLRRPHLWQIATRHLIFAEAFSPSLFPTFFHILFPSLLIRTSVSALQSRHAHGTIYGEISRTGSS